jgi:hypothetical protein
VINVNYSFFSSFKSLPFSSGSYYNFNFMLSVEVVATGIWSAPGDSEEVAVALSQALRNRIERLALSNRNFI